MNRNDTTLVNLTPGTAQMVRTLNAKASLTPHAAINELIDNSLDADASIVEVVYVRGDGILIVGDDGHGTDEVEMMVTPYRRKDHATTKSGLYGIGGTTAMIWLTDADGLISVESVSSGLARGIMVDLRQVVQHDQWQGRRYQPSLANGTRVTLERCRKIRETSIRKVEETTSILYAPALREGRRIRLTFKDVVREVRPFSAPKACETTPFAVEVAGCRVTGFCSLVEPGERNPIKGWAVAYGHRFVKVGTLAPALGATVDPMRIHGEIELPRNFPGINDQKDGFVEEPEDLWEAVGAACKAVVDRAQAEGVEYELKATLEAAQAYLDQATDRLDVERIKGRRRSDGRDPDSEGVQPTGTGSPHERFSRTQPGNKRGRPRKPTRIKISFSSGLDTPYMVSPASTCVHVSIDREKCLKAFVGAEMGWPLALFVAQAVAADAHARRENYTAMFPMMRAEGIPDAFAEIARHMERDQVAMQCAS